MGGYYVDKYAERFNIRSRIMLTIIIAVIICGAVMNYVLAAHFGLIKDYIALGNTGLLVFIMTFMIFLMARKNEYRLPPNKWIIAVSEASFGMYLIHPFFLVLLRGLWPNYQSIQYFPVLMIVVPVVSFFAVTMMRKVEFMRQFC